jgi:hypothetical protein
MGTPICRIDPARVLLSEQVELAERANTLPDMAVRFNPDWRQPPRDQTPIRTLVDADEDRAFSRFWLTLTGALLLAVIAAGLWMAVSS